MSETPDDDSDPTLSGTHTAVLDRFEDDRAVLVVEAGGTDVAERVVERAALPDDPDARAVDAVFTVEFDDGTAVAFTYQPETAAERAESAQDRFDRLAGRRRRESDQSADAEGEESDS